jgi:hypothetical protein
LSPPVPDKKVVKIIKTERGEIRVSKLPVLGIIPVYEQQSGKKVGDIYGSQNNKSIVVPSGNYKLKFDNQDIEVVVEAGQEVIIE